MSILKVNTIQDKGGNNLLVSDGAGTISSGGLITNTPSFFAYVSSNISLSAGTKTKIQFNTKVFDTDSAYDNSTNYRFTVPSGKAGKYFFNSKIYFTIPEAVSLFNRAELFFYKNGTELGDAILDDRENYGTQNTVNDSIILDLNVSDYVEVYGRFNVQGGTPTVTGGTTYYRTVFQGHKLI